MTQNKTGSGDGGGDTSNHSDTFTLELLNERIQPYLTDFVLKPQVAPHKVAHFDDATITFTAHLNIRNLNATEVSSTIVAMWQTYLLGSKTQTIADTSEQVSVFADHRGCTTCAGVFHEDNLSNPNDDGEYTCPEQHCEDEKLEIVRFPNSIDIEQTVEFPEEHRPVETVWELEDALSEMTGTDIDLS